MTAPISLILGRTRGHRPRLQAEQRSSLKPLTSLYARRRVTAGFSIGYIGQRANENTTSQDCSGPWIVADGGCLCFASRRAVRAVCEGYKGRGTVPRNGQSVLRILSQRTRQNRRADVRETRLHEHCRKRGYLGEGGPQAARRNDASSRSPSAG